MKTRRICEEKRPDTERALRASAPDLFVAAARTSSSCRQPRSSRRGQQVAEYMVMFAAVAAAFLAIHVYARRGLQARIKELVDVEVGPQIDSSPMTVPKAQGWSSSNMTSEVYSNARDIQEGQETRSWFETASSTSGVAVSVMNEDMSTEG